MLVLFLILLIAPLVARDEGISVNLNIMSLMQPLDTDNNDTISSYTGNGLPVGYSAWTPSAASASA